MTKNKNYIENFRDRSFRYEQPFFYNNQFALRCELGMGNGVRKYLKNAYIRAVEIFDIMFPIKPDLLVIEHGIYDYTSPLNEDTIEFIDNIISSYKEEFKALRKFQSLGNCEMIKDLTLTEDEKEEDLVRLNRFLIHNSKNNIKFNDLIKNQIGKMGLQNNTHLIHFVSKENDCVMTIYDDRGCDIAFSSKDQGKPFYEKLKPYLLQHDIERMKAIFE